MSSISPAPLASSRLSSTAANTRKKTQPAPLEIARRGYRVIRFWNNDVMHNLAGVLEVHPTGARQ
jgi:very-short-patch-repair endonuclease